jgi:hypothetical protein
VNFALAASRRLWSIEDLGAAGVVREGWRAINLFTM